MCYICRKPDDVLQQDDVSVQCATYATRFSARVGAGAGCATYVVTLM